MTVPEDIVVLLAAGIGFLVTNGLKSLFPNWDMSKATQQITAALVACVVALANQGLGYVPVEYQQIVLTVFTLVVSILGVFGVHYSLKQLRPTK